jgi:hypothetical protein
MEIGPNSQSTLESSSGNNNLASNWLAAEQSFITRITRPFNQSPITEYSTVFAGILRADQSIPMKFLFSVPNSLEMQSLKLMIETETFPIEE